MKRFHLLLLAATIFSSPSEAATVLFSDLGPTGSAYDDSFGYVVCGSGPSGCQGTSFTNAQPFTVSGSGSAVVTQIDLGILRASGLGTFAVSIWTVNLGGNPGVQVAGASWNSTSNDPPCCPLLSITNISGVTLTGGAEYFLVLGPLNLTDNSASGLIHNNQGVTGHVLFSTDGGSNWFDGGISSSPLGAFDVLGDLQAIPEPSSTSFLVTGLIGVFMGCRRARGRCGH